MGRGEGLLNESPDRDGEAHVRPGKGEARGRFERLTTWGLLAPPVVWLVVFFVLPILVVAAYSVGALSLFPGDQGFSLEDWRRFVTAETLYFPDLFMRSIATSLVVSVIVVLLAYPLAYYLALCTGKRKYLLLVLTIAPFLTSYLLRVFAWKLILGDEGVVNSFLFWTGLRAEGDPISWLIYSRFTVMLVLVYVWVPFVALPIFVALDGLDTRLLEAANDLGARRFAAFRRVTLPLSLRGVAAAFVFVFIPTIGEFVTPQLVGGTSGFLYGNAIADAFGQGLNWQRGSVLSLFLLATVAVLLLLAAPLLRQREAEPA